MKTLAIFGSTGSIGKSSLYIYKKNKKNFKLIYLTANKNSKKLFKQVKEFNPKYYFLNNNSLNENKKIKSLNYFLKKKIKIDYIISGVSGYEALDLNFKLCKIAKNLLIANKETIICGGKIFLKYAKINKCKIVPIDSEHHCIDFFLQRNDLKNIKYFYLMGSGGPFFKKDFNYDHDIKDVINHPNWSMGKKISIYSSNLTNKVLELFEAKILFNIPADKIFVKIDETSQLHSIFVLKNNLTYFVLHYPCMTIPISNALGTSENKSLNLSKLKINLFDPDKKKFPIIKLGQFLLKKNHNAMIIFTVLNDRLTELYIGKKLKYGQIVDILIKLFKSARVLKLFNHPIKTKKDIMKLIDIASEIKLI